MGKKTGKNPTDRGKLVVKRSVLVDGRGVPLAAAVLCLHSRRDDEVPFGYSERYVAAATRAGGTAVLRETAGDHYTLIDPGTADWQAVVEALPGLAGHHDHAGL